MTRKKGWNSVPPVKPSNISLGTVLLHKRLRIGEDNGQILTQTRSRRPNLTLVITYSFDMYRIPVTTCLSSDVLVHQ